MAHDPISNSAITRFIAAGAVLAAVMLVGVRSAAPADAEPPVFGEAVNGLRLALEVKPASWQPGDKVEFVCTVKNISKKPVRIAAWGLDLAQALEVTDAAGNVLKHDGGRDATRMMPPDAFPTIAPGESKRFTLTGRLTEKKMLIVNELLGGIWHWSLADGDYTIRAVFDRSPDDEWMKRQAGAPYWTGKAFSAPVKVTVGAAGPRAGEPVSGLKLTLSADKTELRMTPRNLRRATRDTPRWNVEPTKLTLTFTNVSDKPIKLNTYDWAWSHMSLDIRGPDAESLSVLRRMVERMMAAPTKDNYPTLEPGASWTDRWHPTFPGDFGETRYVLLKPGEYRITATYACAERHLKQSEHANGSWTGLVTSNEIVLNAVPHVPAGKAPAD